MGDQREDAAHEHHYENIGYQLQGKPDYHRPCRKTGCGGIAFVQIAWAPDTGWHWLRCCCCGDYWNPGVAR